MSWWPADCRAPTVWALAARVTGTVGFRATAPTVSTTAPIEAVDGAASAADGRTCSSAVFGAGAAAMAVARGSSRANRSRWVSAVASV